MALTKEQEVELLRLRKRKAMAEAEAAAQQAVPAPGPEGQAPAAPDATPADEQELLAPESALGAAVRGVQQAPFGIGDEAGGVLGAVDELARRPFGGGQYQDKPLRQALVDRYLLERNANRQELAQARAARPMTTGAAEMIAGLALPLPGAGAIRAAAQAGKVGQAALRAGALGFGVGALTGLGHSEEGTAAGQVKDALVGGAIGGLTMAPFGAGAAKVSAAKAKAAQDAVEKTQKEADKAMRSARSALGGETSSGFRTIEQLERALNDPGVDPAARQAALDFLTSPEGQALKNQVLESASRRGGGQVARIQDAEQAFADASAATDPAAVKAATEAYLAEGIKPEVLPRLGTVLTRVIPLTIGTSVTGALGGGWASTAAGGVVGGMAALAMGSPGRTFANMIRSPRFRHSAASYAVPILEAAAARGPAALGAAYYLLHTKDPEVRAAAEAAAKDEEAAK